MSTIHWGRMVIAGVVAATLGFLTDGLLHERLIHADWEALYMALQTTPPQEHGGGLAYFAIFELGRGLLSMLLYCSLRAQLGPGPRTAVVAGVAAWAAVSVTGPAQFIPLAFFSHALWFKAAAFQLVTTILATLAGAALYRPGAAPTSSARL